MELVNNYVPIDSTMSNLNETEKRYAAEAVGFGTDRSPWMFDTESIRRLAGNKLSIGMESTADINRLVSSFNIARLPDYMNVTMPYTGYLIFTRPSLYLDSAGGSPYPSTYPNIQPNPGSNYMEMLRNPKTSAFVGDPVGIRMVNMLSSTVNGSENRSYYMPLFTTRAMNYQTVDVDLKTVEKAQTFYGQTTRYGMYSNEHKVGGTVSLDFRNDRYWSIMTAIYIWMSYIHIVSHSSSIKPNMKHQENAILDYCGSIYYLVTLMDMRTLIYWEKLTGVFPIKAPFSMFAYTDTAQIEEKLSVDFHYGIRSEPKDIQVLLDLNYLSGIGPAFVNDDSIRWGSQNGFLRPDGWHGVAENHTDVYASRPIISELVDSTGRGSTFYLNWK